MSDFELCVDFGLLRVQILGYKFLWFHWLREVGRRGGILDLRGILVEFYFEDNLIILSLKLVHFDFHEFRIKENSNLCFDSFIEFETLSLVD